MKLGIANLLLVVWLVGYEFGDEVGTHKITLIRSTVEELVFLLGSCLHASGVASLRLILDKLAHSIYLLLCVHTHVH